MKLYCFNEVFTRLVDKRTKGLLNRKEKKAFEVLKNWQFKQLENAYLNN